MMTILERKIRIGDLLVMLTIVGSLISGLHAWHEDRDIQQKAAADKVRAAIAATIVGIDRWRDVSLSQYDEALAIFDQAKETLRQEQQNQRATGQQWINDREGERNSIWLSLLKAEAATRKTHRDDNIEAAYIALYGYDPSGTRNLSAIIQQAEDDEAYAFAKLRTDSQAIVLKQEATTYNSAGFYNEMHGTLEPDKNEYVQTLDSKINSVKSRLTALISEADSLLLSGPQSIASEKNSS